MKPTLKEWFGKEVTQLTLTLRIGCAVYLIYLAWELRGSVLAGDIPFLLAALAFFVIGAALGTHSLVKLIRREYTVPSSPEEEEETA